MSDDQKSYNDEEVNAILRLALERQFQRQSVSGTTKDDLLEVARETGISQEDLEAAIFALESENDENLDTVSLENYRKYRERRRWSEFWIHVSTYALVMVFLFGINVLTTGLGTLWFLYPALGWGLALGLHGASIALSEEDPVKLEEDFEKERYKRKRRREKEEDRRRRQETKETLVRSATDFGHAVTQGTSTLLDSLSRQINDRTAPTASEEEESIRALPASGQPRVEIDVNNVREETVTVGAGASTDDSSPSR